VAKKKKRGSSVFKTVLKVIGGVFAVILVSIIGAGIAIMIIVDKPFVEGKMAAALNRHVSIGAVNVSVFSVLSGIEVKEVAISNYKSPKEIEALKGKPVSSGDTFVGLKSFNFKVAFGPLLHKQFVLKELTLYSPIANIVRFKDGQFNFSDLLVQKPLTAEEQAAEAKAKAEAKAEEAKKAKLAAKEAAKNPSKPLSADDIPLKITIGKIGTENGTVNFTDQSTGQQVEIYNLTAKVYDISIDPKNLSTDDLVKIKAGFGIKTVGKSSSGSVKSFDITTSLDGNVIPFDKATKLLNPEITIKAGSPKGSMNGLQVFDKMKSISALEKYCGKFSFLKDDITWSDAFIGVSYKDSIVKFSDGRIKTGDFLMTFSGQLNTATTAVKSSIDLVLSEKHTATVRDGIKKNADKVITGSMKKVVTADKVADAAMKSLANKEGKVYIKYDVKGTLSSPDATMAAPKLPDIKDIIKDAAGNLADAAKDKAKEVAEKKIDEGKKQAEDKAKKEAAKKMKKIKL
jgi:hypothetical protein